MAQHAAGTCVPLLATVKVDAVAAATRRRRKRGAIIGTKESDLCVCVCTQQQVTLLFMSTDVMPRDMSGIIWDVVHMVWMCSLTILVCVLCQNSVEHGKLLSQLSNNKNNINTSATGTLRQDRTLYEGETLTSPNGQYVLKLQNRGNLIMLDQRKGETLWMSGSARRADIGATITLVMQNDCNLVIYASGKHALWASGPTGDSRHACRLRLQDDGNMVIYTKDQSVVWTSNTCDSTLVK